MAGLLTHLCVSLVCGLAIAYYFRKWIYGGVFALGQLTPDLIDFGITGIKTGSLNPSVIIRDPWFNPLRLFGHSAFNWLVIFAIIFFLIFFVSILFRKLEKHKFILYFSLVFFLGGVFVHLLLDRLIQERSRWI
jgi:hypothetical protein